MAAKLKKDAQKKPKQKPTQRQSLETHLQNLRKKLRPNEAQAAIRNWAEKELRELGRSKHFNSASQGRLRAELEQIIAPYTRAIRLVGRAGHPAVGVTMAWANKRTRPTDQRGWWKNPTLSIEDEFNQRFRELKASDVLAQERRNENWSQKEQASRLEVKPDTLAKFAADELGRRSKWFEQLDAHVSELKVKRLRSMLLSEIEQLKNDLKAAPLPQGLGDFEAIEQKRVRLASLKAVKIDALQEVNQLQNQSNPGC